MAPRKQKTRGAPPLAPSPLCRHSGAMARPAIRVSDLSKSYDGVLAVDAVDFEVAAGAITGLLGSNGAGVRILGHIPRARPDAMVATTHRKGGIRAKHNASQHISSFATRRFALPSVVKIGYTLKSPTRETTFSERGAP